MIVSNRSAGLPAIDDYLGLQNSRTRIERDGAIVRAITILDKELLEALNKGLQESIKYQEEMKKNMK